MIYASELTFAFQYLHTQISAFPTLYEAVIASLYEDTDNIPYVAAHESCMMYMQDVVPMVCDDLDVSRI